MQSIINRTLDLLLFDKTFFLNTFVSKVLKRLVSRENLTKISLLWCSKSSLKIQKLLLKLLPVKVTKRKKSFTRFLSEFYFTVKGFLIKGENLAKTDFLMAQFHWKSFWLIFGSQGFLFDNILVREIKVPKFKRRKFLIVLLRFSNK